ncbi:MAG: GSCFA domain-containing protein [Bacteroidales bacterium]
MGSCFSDNIGKKTETHKFQSISNPFGVIYNPASVKTHLQEMHRDDFNFSPHLRRGKELWFDYRFHGSFSHINKEKAAQTMTSAVKQAKNHFQQCDALFITWGTARIYRLKDNKQVVANCHKQAAGNFAREKLTTEGIVADYTTLLNKIFDKLPDIQIVLTVSPVRHLKDGFVGNQRSKAVLLLAAEKLETRFEQVSYFPAYEILMDDLRDYRFYDRDLTHPSPEAVDYLWECFSETYFDDSTKKLNKELKKLHTACQHKMHFPESTAAKQFAQTQLRLIEKLEKKHPYLNLEAEKKYFTD